ncbi:curli-like amyloid fiber formation chaperone CsgH [Aureimonas phyllosphaerae]|uniref:curli-like amyloid fiber formation chaperone CsgH n=1 Tax=Aureimonas phyllosphaerae TaxID=1166078 RepID=UPI003A5C3636
MPSIPSATRRAGALLLAAVASLAAAGLTTAAPREAGPARCEIRLDRTGGSVTLTALAHADKRVAGRYSLRVSGAGTDIRQGGPFEAAPGRTTTLGTVSLSLSGGSARADLDLDVGGETLSCSQRIGDGI